MSAGNKLKVTYVDNSATQYDGFADEIKYATGSKKVKGKLFLGDRHSCAMVQLKHRNCQAVVNCDTDLFGLAKEKDIRYLKIDPCADFEDNNKNISHALSIFDLAFHFIDQELDAGHNILVHCEKGVTKSAAVVIYYLMKRQNISLASAFKEVKSYRESVMPQPSLFRHLIAAEIKLRGVDSVRLQGKSIVYLEKGNSLGGKRGRDGNGVDGEDPYTSQRYFVGGVLVSIVAMLFLGLYLMAGKL